MKITSILSVLSLFTLLACSPKNDSGDSHADHDHDAHAHEAEGHDGHAADEGAGADQGHLADSDLLGPISLAGVSITAEVPELAGGETGHMDLKITGSATTDSALLWYGGENDAGERSLSVRISLGEGTRHVDLELPEQLNDGDTLWLQAGEIKQAF